MKTQYKNKRDFYKAETERLAKQVEFWRNENEAKRKKISELTKEPEEPRVKCAWFCPNCRVVAQGMKGRDYELEGGRCLECGYMGIRAVSKLPFGF